MIDDLEVEIALPFARGARVLELGCGTGLILSRLAPVAREAVGIDLSPRMAEHARARGLEVHVGNLCDLPFESDRFDLTCSFKVLAHVRDIEDAIREAARVTRPGGHLLLELYNPWSLRYAAKRAAGPRPIGRERTEAEVYTRWDSPSAIPALLPPDVELVDYRGVRVLTPFAAVHRLPWISRPLRRAEAWAMRSNLRRFGGFLVAVLRKQAVAG
jgi:SAM-dependent methyltransferase